MAEKDPMSSGEVYSREAVASRALKEAQVHPLLARSAILAGVRQLDGEVAASEKNLLLFEVGEKIARDESTLRSHKADGPRFSIQFTLCLFAELPKTPEWADEVQSVAIRFRDNEALRPRMDAIMQMARNMRAECGASMSQPEVNP